MSRIVDIKNVKKGGSVTPPAAPVYADSDFIEWYPDSYKNVTSDLNIYTRYELKKFTVNFIYNGSVVKTQSGVIYGTSATPPIMDTRSGYTFYWDDYSKITDNCDINGDYYRNDGEFLVTFYDYYGKIAKSGFVKRGTSATPPVLEQEIYDTTQGKYYTFQGWDRDYTNIVKDINIYSVYEKKIMKITFKVASNAAGTNKVENVQYDITDLMQESICVSNGSKINQNQFPGLDKYVITATDEGGVIKVLSDKCFSGSKAGAGLTNAIFNRAETIGNQCFNSCDKLVSVSLQRARNIGTRAFYGCKSLTTISLPYAKTINNEAFINLSKLTTVDIPDVTSIGMDAFQNCKAITSVNMPSIQQLESDAFYQCKSIKELNMPNVKTIGEKSFYGCYGLTSVNMENVETIGSYAFGYNGGYSTVKTITIPKVTKLSKDAFTQFKYVTKMTLNSQLKTTSSAALKVMFGIGSYNTSTDIAKNGNKEQIDITWVE